MKLPLPLSLFNLLVIVCFEVLKSFFCADAAGPEGYESSDHTEETSLFSVERPILSAGHLPAALSPEVN